MNAESVDRVAVLGAGPRGHGVAEVAALGGVEVSLRGLTREDAERGRAQVRWSLDRLVERGRLSTADADAALARVAPHEDLAAAVAGADLVVEAVPDRDAVRRDLYDALAGLPPDRALLVTTAPGAPVTEVAALGDRPAKTCGLRTFPPAVTRTAVEVVGGAETDGATLDAVCALARRLGRTPLRLPDDPPGGVVDRVLAPAVGEAAWLVADGAAPAAVDAGARAVGLDPGPLALGDRFGLDRVTAVLGRLEDEFGDRYAVPPALSARVDAGDLGAKTGGGFFDGAPPADGTGDAALGRRVLAVLARETAALAATGVADSATVDRAVSLATGLPRGPAALADETGLAALVDALDDGARDGGATALRERASAGRPFRDDHAAGVRVARPADGVVRVVLDRPGRANTLDVASVERVATTVEDAAAGDAGCVVLTGARGRPFSAGVDVEGAGLSRASEAEATAFARRGADALGRVADADVPVVAAVDGACLGAGLTLAACADLRVATERATFGHPARNLGLAPAWGGTARLPAALGEARARELLLTGDRYAASRLYADGFLADVVPDADALWARADALAADVADASPAAVSAVRASLRTDPALAALDDAAETFGRLVVSDDARRALRAYRRGDPPAGASEGEGF